MTIRNPLTVQANLTVFALASALISISSLFAPMTFAAESQADGAANTTLASETDPESVINDGSSLIKAMHAKYIDTWYKAFTMTQRIDFYRDGEVAKSEVWDEWIQSPGQIRVDKRDVSPSNTTLVTEGQLHVFHDGVQVHKAPMIHPLLLLGFDVYVQSPEESLLQLKSLKFDTTLFCESEWNGEAVYIIGSDDPELQSKNQAWIAKDTLLFVRMITPTQNGGVSETLFNAYKPLGEGWIATEVIFKRNGQITALEEYLEYEIQDDGIDAAIFDATNLKTDL